MAICYYCKEKEKMPDSNFCSEECRVAYWEKAFSDVKVFEADGRLGIKNRKNFRILHERITNYQKKIAEAKEEYWKLCDYFNKENGRIWKSMRHKDEVVNKLEEKFGIINRGQ